MEQHSNRVRLTRGTKTAGVSAAVAIAIAMVVVLLVPPSGGQGTVAGQQTGQAELAASTSYPVLAAVGDIACPPGSTVTATTCQHAAVANRVRQINPTYLLTLGDHQYQNNTYSDFMNSYDRSWGSLKSKTKPVLGNHEYYTRGAAGFFQYFPNIPKRGYYAFNTGGWRIYMLNSECKHVDCAAETTWLANDLKANPRKCSLIAMHTPRYSSGFEHGSSTVPRQFWRKAVGHHVDVALAGHDHDYERFQRLDAWGNKTDAGILSFVSGAGGKNLYHMGTKKVGSRFFQAKQFGVLKLTLKPRSYDYNYLSTSGVSLDKGTRDCV